MQAVCQTRQQCVLSARLLEHAPVLIAQESYQPLVLKRSLRQRKMKATLDVA